MLFVENYFLSRTYNVTLYVCFGFLYIPAYYLL